VLPRDRCEAFHEALDRELRRAVRLVERLAETPCTLPMVTRRPPTARSNGIAARLTAITPKKFTSRFRRRLSIVDISIVGSKLEMPALLTTASRRP